MVKGGFIQWVALFLQAACLTGAAPPPWQSVNSTPSAGSLRGGAPPSAAMESRPRSAHTLRSDAASSVAGMPPQGPTWEGEPPPLSRSRSMAGAGSVAVEGLGQTTPRAEDGLSKAVAEAASLFKGAHHVHKEGTGRGSTSREGGTE